MKSFILKSGLVACLFVLGLPYGNVSAESSWASKCGEITPNQNPDAHQINCLLTNAALEANIPPEVVKAVAEQESGWKQFDANGQPLVTEDGGIGIMQITNQLSYDQDQLKAAITYNIQAGVDILKSNYNRNDLPKIKGAGQEVIENWYFPVMAYNGTKPVNSPLVQADGSKNTNAYQEKVFTAIENDSFLNDTSLAEFPFSTADFDYNPDSDENIKFNKLEYTITDQMHASAYHFQPGEKVIVTIDGARFRVKIDSTTGSQLLAKNTTLIIDGDFVYDQYNSGNRFVWYPVKTADGKLGYITSAYIMQKLEAPVVNPVNDKDVSLSGKAPFANVTVQIMNGTALVGSGLADANGNFKADIPAQKEGTSLTVTYKDHLNRVSEPASITVQQSVLNGWVTKDGKTYHYVNGVLSIGWYKEGTSWYYFGADGVMKTGWLKDGYTWYYLGANGVMKTGWLKDGYTWYYLSGSGAMKTGWLKDGYTWYYLSSSGAMKTGWLKDGSNWYYLSGSGAMQTGWLKEGSSWYYLAGSGKMLTGWQYINGKWYYFYSSGVMAYNTTIGGYRLGSSGAMI